MIAVLARQARALAPSWNDHFKSKIKFGETFAYALILIVALVVRGAYLGDPAPDYDEQLYQFIGSRMLDGHLPYVDLWDRKPIGLFLLYAFANLFGADVLPYQIMALLCAAAGGAMVYRLAVRFGDRVAGVVAASLYILGLSAFGAAIGQSEVFYLPIAIGMAMILLRCFECDDLGIVVRLAALSMALGGIMLQLKYTTAPQCVFFGIASVWRLRQLGIGFPRLLGYASLFGAIGLLPTMAAGLAYASMGHLDAFVYANFTSIFARGHLTGPYEHMFKAKVALMALPLVGVALVAVVRRRQENGADEWGAYGLIACWTGAAAIGFLMIGNIYLHYFIPVLPGILVLAAPMLGKDYGGAVVAPLLLTFFCFAANISGASQVTRSDRSGISRATAAARPHVAREGQCLYVFDGPTALYRTTESCLPTAYVYPDHLSNSMEAAAIGVDPAAEVARILAARPSVIVTASEPIVPRYNSATERLVDRAIELHYVRTATIYYFQRYLFVNVRRDLVPKERSGRLPPT